MEYQTVEMPQEVKQARADKIEKSLRLLWIVRDRHYAQVDRIDKILYDVGQYIPQEQRVAIRDAD